MAADRAYVRATRRQARPGLVDRVTRLDGRGPVVHGTRGGYVRGCSCDPCTDAEAAYSRARWHKRKAAR